MVNVSSSGVLPARWWERSVTEIASLTPVQRLQLPELAENNVEVAIKRDDQLDPFLSGNKFYKLFGHVRAFLESTHTQWLTFGGAFSNHLHAFAAASAQLGIPAIAVIRGEKPATLSATLADVERLGVRLKFVTRSDYRLKDQSAWITRLKEELGDFYCVPEGGSGLLGAQGCALWTQQALAMSPWRPTALCLSAGTGCSTAGVLSAADGVPVHSYLSIKGTEADRESFTADVTAQAQKIAEMRGNRYQMSALRLECNYHCGGYARFPSYLREFLVDFEARTGLLLDPVYTAKLFWGVVGQVRAGVWPSGAKLLILHTGGLQGRRGINGL